MQLVTVRWGGGLRAARSEGDELVLLDAPDVGALLAAPGDWRKAAAAVGPRVPTAAAALAPVVPRPEKVICVGLNYRSHAEETGLGIPEYPTIFAKYARALIGPYDAIQLPATCSRADWEAELAVIVGDEVRDASTVEAAAAIAGYAVANDVSMRDWQVRTRQWLQGKTFEATTPVGPALVTLDELEHPDDLRLVCEVDAEIVQDTTTADLIFSPAEIIAYVSGILTLAPGDVILTGTPSGIGARMDPPRFLVPGTVVRTWIDGLGELRNECAARVTRSITAPSAPTAS